MPLCVYLYGPTLQILGFNGLLERSDSRTNLSVRPCLVTERNLDLATITLLFIFCNYCSIIDYLNLKNLSRKLQTNYVIIY